MGAGVLEVRAPAEVGEVALPVERDHAVRGVDELDLVRLALGLEVAPGLLAGELPALPGPALGDLAAHLVLESGQVLLAHRLGKLEVVVEAVLDGRADRDLRARGRGVSPLPRAGARRSGGARRGRRDRACPCVVRKRIALPSARGRRTSCTPPSTATSTACSASFGPMARAASSPVAPSGSSSSAPSGRVTFTRESLPRQSAGQAAWLRNERR